MSESHRLSRVVRCEKHNEQLVSICIAPECFNFREMCSICKNSDSLHNKMHYDRNEAFQKIQELIDNLFKGLKALRLKIIQTMDTKINSQHGLTEIETKLEQIKKMLNDKIDNFHMKLRKIYETNVKHKLNELYAIVDKSYEFLEEEKIKLFRNEKLKPFFVSDLKHDLKYFESYYEEILEKNVRRFKAGFEHDNVLKMMVCFEQNMEEIFKFQNPEYGNLSIDHILYSNLRGNSIMKMKGTSLTKVDLNFLNKEVADSKLKESESWIGIIPSVYYTPKDCYYLIGAGKKESNKIRRLHIETNEIKNMEVRMETKRMNFSICLFNQEIFITGGENFKEGCLSKCEKFIPSEGKVYIVSSLNQKSSQHSLCVYKNKFILKFGGTDIMESILETHNERYFQLNPEIYSADTEDWKVLSFQRPGTSLMGSRINFGLWPGIFTLPDENKIIILASEMSNHREPAHRYDIDIEEEFNEVSELFISKSRVYLPSNHFIFPNCSTIGDDENIYFAALDLTKGSGLFYVASIFRQPTENLLEVTKI